MIPNPAEILRRIVEGSLLAADVVRGLDHDAILDARDGDAAFELEWTRCYKAIEAQWPAADIDAETARAVEDVRREAFLAVSRATVQHEIASYVSDDFDLIGRGAILGLDDAFLNGLWEAYDRQEIPGP